MPTEESGDKLSHTASPTADTTSSLSTASIATSISSALAALKALAETVQEKDNLVISTTAQLAQKEEALTEATVRMSTLDQTVGTLTTEKETAHVQYGEVLARLQAIEAELADIRRELAALKGLTAPELAEQTTEGDRGETQAHVEGDDLTEIKGIGPMFASRLATAGIGRFAILAAAEPREVALAAGVREWQNADIDDWIDQARVLARRPRQVQIGDDLTRVEGVGPAYAIRLRAAGITTFAQLAGADETALSEIVGAPGWRRINYGDWIAQARLAAAGDESGLKTLQDELNRRKGDNLALIKGIGQATAAALRQAGITDYGTLANTSPETLRGIGKQHGLRGGDYAAWVDEARLRAARKRIERAATRSRSVQGTTVRSCPQDLEAVRGIGQTYEQRLYAVGIGTYWELGMVPAEELEAILDIRDFQDVDLAAIQAAAMQLAAETETMGHTWDGSEPDDFEIMEGIGPVLERRLYAAGICTYAALASATPDMLAAICQAPALQQPDYMRWIEQAQARLALAQPST